MPNLLWVANWYVRQALHSPTKAWESSCLASAFTAPILGSANLLVFAPCIQDKRVKHIDHHHRFHGQEENSMAKMGLRSTKQGDWEVGGSATCGHHSCTSSWLHHILVFGSWWIDPWCRCLLRSPVPSCARGLPGPWSSALATTSGTAGGQHSVPGKEWTCWCFLRLHGSKAAISYSDLEFPHGWPHPWGCGPSVFSSGLSSDS